MPVVVLKRVASLADVRARYGCSMPAKRALPREWIGHGLGIRVESRVAPVHGTLVGQRRQESTIAANIQR
jgi:hypothetical protein